VEWEEEEVAEAGLLQAEDEAVVELHQPMGTTNQLSRSDVPLN